MIQIQKRIRSLPKELREKTKCPYCVRGFHPEIHCRKKQINQLSTLLEENNIALPHGANNFDVGP